MLWSVKTPWPASAARALRHVAAGAIETAGALGLLVAGETFGAKPRGAFGCGGHGVRVVAGAAPQAVARSALAATLGKFLDVAIDLEVACACGHEVSDEIGQDVARRGNP